MPSRHCADQHGQGPVLTAGPGKQPPCCLHLPILARFEQPEGHHPEAQTWSCPRSGRQEGRAGPGHRPQEKWALGVAGDTEDPWGSPAVPFGRDSERWQPVGGAVQKRGGPGLTGGARGSRGHPQLCSDLGQSTVLSGLSLPTGGGMHNRRGVCPVRGQQQAGKAHSQFLARDPGVCGFSPRSGLTGMQVVRVMGPAHTQPSRPRTAAQLHDGACQSPDVQNRSIAAPSDRKRRSAFRLSLSSRGPPAGLPPASGAPAKRLQPRQRQTREARSRLF